MKRLVAVAVLVALLSVAAAAGGGRAPLLAVAGSSLTWVDPVTLRSLGPSVPIGEEPVDWAYSPDRRVVALARPGAPELRLFDTSSLREVGAITLPGAGEVMRWGSADRVLVLQQPRRRDAGARAAGAATVVDIPARRVVRHLALPGVIAATDVLPDAIVALLQPRRGIGAARIAMLDVRGRIRSIPLDVRIGEVATREGGTWTVVRQVVPGLAVDPERRRAFVLGDSGTVAELGLKSLSVRYRALPERQTALAAKRGYLAGSWRSARWLGSGLLAFWGHDRVGTSARPATELVGLRTLDTRTWSVRVIDRRPAVFEALGGLLIATGTVGSPSQVFGLVAYGRNGTPRYRLLPGEHVYLHSVAGRIAYVFHGHHGSHRRSVIDLERGVVLRTETADWRLPRLLTETTLG